MAIDGGLWFDGRQLWLRGFLGGAGLATANVRVRGGDGVDGTGGALASVGAGFEARGVDENKNTGGVRINMLGEI